MGTSSGLSPEFMPKTIQPLKLLHYCRFGFHHSHQPPHLLPMYGNHFLKSLLGDLRVYSSMEVEAYTGAAAPKIQGD